MHTQRDMCNVGRETNRSCQTAIVQHFLCTSGHRRKRARKYRRKWRERMEDPFFPALIWAVWPSLFLGSPRIIDCVKTGREESERCERRFIGQKSDGFLLDPRYFLAKNRLRRWREYSRKERHCALLNIVKIQKIHFGEEYFLGNSDKYFEWGYNTKKFTLEKNVFLEPVRIFNGAITRS